jgi:hypothetical protein
MGWHVPSMFTTAVLGADAWYQFARNARLEPVSG